VGAGNGSVTHWDSGMTPSGVIQAPEAVGLRIRPQPQHRE
jgi:hypothetical protein